MFGLYLPLLLCLSALCGGMKRSAPRRDDDEDYVPDRFSALLENEKGLLTRKRCRLINGPINDALLNNDPTSLGLLLEAFQGEAEADFYRLFSKDEIEDHLFDAIMNDNVRLLERMLSYSVYRSNLTSKLITKAIKYAVPDVLFVTINAKQEDREDGIFVPSGRFRKFLSVAVVYCHSSAKLLLDHGSPDHVILLSGTTEPELTRKALQKFTERLERPLRPGLLDMVSVLGSYLPYSRLSFFFNNLDNLDRLPAHTPPIVLQLKRMAAFIELDDADGLRAHFSNIHILVKPESQILIAAHLATFAGRAHLLASLPTNVRFDPSNDGKKYHWILKNALISGQFTETLAFLESADPQNARLNLEKRLGAIIEKGILDADIEALYRLNKGWPHDLCQLSHNQMIFLRLAERSLKGDWRNLLIFMELHPQRIMLADAAWNLILDPVKEDRFTKFLINF